MTLADAVITYVELILLLIATVILRSLWRWSAQKVSEVLDGFADGVR